MHTQLDGRPGEGTIGIVSNTEVQRMIQEEDSQTGRRGRSRGQPANSEVVQSPSVRHLESQLGVTHLNDAGGVSNF